MKANKINIISKLSAFAMGLAMLTSCVESSTSTGSAAERNFVKNTTIAKPVTTVQQKQQTLFLEYKERRKKRIEAHQARIRALQNPQIKTAALVTPKKPTVKTKRKVRKASVGGAVRSAGGITQNASLRCVPKRLRNVIYQVSRKFGHVIVNSTGRSRRHNRRIGGARHSYHIGCRAVDFRVRGNPRGLYRYLRNHPSVGGLKRYRSGFYHIDTGPRRSW